MTGSRMSCFCGECALQTANGEVGRQVKSPYNRWGQWFVTVTSTV